LIRSLADKVRRLTDDINDRKLAFNALSAKNALLEADITVSDQQFHEVENQLKRFQIENEHLINQIRKEHKQEKDVIKINSMNISFENCCCSSSMCRIY